MTKARTKLAFSSLPRHTHVVWAKSGDSTGHGLLAHLLDVAAVVEILLEREPLSTLRWAGTQFGLPHGQLVRWIAALSGLHDFGKAVPGFQAKWEAGKEADEAQGLTFPLSALNMDRHDLATNALLGKPLQQQSGVRSKWLVDAVQAISAHHGYHFLRSEWNGYVSNNEPALWAQSRNALLTAYWQVLSPQGSPSLEELTTPAVNWLAGLTSAADWIASNPEWFALGERGHDDLFSYFDDARQLAYKALQRIGWSQARTLLTAPAQTDDLLARITRRSDLRARPLQDAGDRLLKEAQGPSLLLVEAPMGEGKTELAFLAHLRLQAANEHRGLYMALPTQATGNAMFTRALMFLEGFSEGRADIQLVHGGAAMNEDMQALRLRGIDDSAEESLSASAWFAQRKRPLLSPYGVGTVDQALFAVLNVKHHFVRMWGLGNRVVVLDEVHAYDAYTNGLIVVLLRWMRALNCSVVLMSATLPQARRNELLHAWGLDHQVIPELAYPRLLLADDNGVRGSHFAARELPPIHVTGLEESLETLAAKALDLLQGGGCGAAIVNTVDRAQQLYLQLRGQLDAATSLLLFHARYPADERSAREKQVLESFGRNGRRPSRALLIATQVAEQSLDLDFDFMLSDLAPVDLLLQRAGRLHRHGRPRPLAHTEARLWVAGLLPQRLPEMKATAWEYVYEPYLLVRTWALLGRESMLQLPGDIDRLVQAVYGDEPLPEELSTTIQNFIRVEIDSHGKYLAVMKTHRQSAANIAIDPDAEPQAAYAHKPRGKEDGDGTGLENRTRLGLDSITLIPVVVDDDGWHVAPGDSPFQPEALLDAETARRLYNRQLRVSSKRVVAHFKKKFEEAPLPGSFSEPVILKNAYPLQLKHGRYDEDGLHLRLDAELGLVYETESNTANAPKEGGT